MLQTRAFLLMLVAVVLLSATPVSAQIIQPSAGNRGGSGLSFRERTQFQSGLFLEFIPVRLERRGDFFRNPPLLYGIHFGMHYLLAQSNDQLSVGVEPGINLSFNYNTFFGTTLLTQVPVFIIGRIGSRATRDNDSPVGFGLGIGANFTYLLLPYDSGFELFRLSQGFLSPAAMVEFTINPTRSVGGAFTLRGHVNLGAFETDYSETLNGQQFRDRIFYENYGIGLIYQF